MVTSDERWDLLRDYAHAVTTSKAVPDLVERSLKSALSLLDAASASISRFETGRGRVRILHNVGELADWEHAWPTDRYYQLDDYTQLMSTVGGHERSWTGSVDDPGTPTPDRELLARLGKTHAASFQVLVADEIWGDLYVTRAEGKAFDPDDCAAGVVLAGLLSAGLSRLELLADLSHLAYTDPLTGLANRRAADEWLERRLDVTAPFPPVSVVLCDINGLKRVNDGFGHTAGDDLVRLAASALVRATEDLRGSSADVADVLAARIGGDEFVVLIDGGDQSQVEAMVKRIADLTLPHDTGLSVGAASTTGRPLGAGSIKTAVRALLRLADAAQYRHKRTRQLGPEALLTPSSPGAALLPAGWSGVVDRALRALATAPDRSPERRLQIVCDEVSLAYDGASWWVSRLRDGALTDVLGRVLRADSRGDLAGLEFVSGDAFDPADYPATAATLGGGSYFATLIDGDPAEKALLARMGYQSVLAAGETAADGTPWLVEIFGDPRTSTGIFAVEPALRALVHLAVVGADA